MKIVRQNMTMKSFIDFDEDKLYGFVKKDGSLDFDGVSLLGEDILPNEFLHLLN